MVVEHILRSLNWTQDDTFTLIYDEKNAELEARLRQYFEAQNISGQFSVRPVSRRRSYVSTDFSDLQNQVVLLAIEKESLKYELRTGIRAMVEHANSRFGNVLNTPYELIEQAFSYDFDTLRKITHNLADYLSDAKQLTIRHSSQAQLVVDLDPHHYKWVSSCGVVPFQARNVIPSEVYTSPISANGLFIVDASYGGVEDRNFQETPMIWRVLNGKIIEVFSEDRSVVRRVHSILDEKNGHLLGEIGIGTNLGLQKPAGVSMVDEKIPGVHIANGKPSDAPGKKLYDSPIHFDGISPNVSLYKNGEEFFAQRTFTINFK